MLKFAVICYEDEWKLELELIQQLVGSVERTHAQMLSGNYTKAIHVNTAALKRHIGAGRLWSSYIQLAHLLDCWRCVTNRAYGPVQALRVFRCALRHVAKSGEVWCEGARIFLNPSSSLFHIPNALKCLNYAVFFTPQYGDSFFEVATRVWREA